MSGKRKCGIYVHQSIIQQKKEIMSSVGKLMELKTIMLNGIRQAEKDKYYIFFLTCRVQIKKKKNAMR
jgi:hypothetical protein